MELSYMSTRIDEDKVIKVNHNFSMATSCDSISIEFYNVIAAGVDSWESSQIKANVRITDKIMDDLCKTWLKHKKKK